MRTNARIYVMQAGDGTIKLGHSRSPERRSKDLGVKVSIVHQTDVVELAEKIERLAHRVLSLHGKHLRGEWFEASIDDAIQAIEIATRQAEGEQLSLGGCVGHWTKGAERKVSVWVSLPPSLVREVDDIRSHWEYPVERTAIIERALRDWVEKNRGGGDGRESQASGATR